MIVIYNRNESTIVMTMASAIKTMILANLALRRNLNHDIARYAAN